MMRKTVLKVIAFIIIGYLIVVGLMTAFQNQMIFHPSSRMIDTPERLGLVWTEHRVETSDGISLHGWMVGDPEELPVVVYSHGNAGNISGRVEIAGEIAEQGAAVFLYDYRGYGRSEGEPSEPGIYDDGESVVYYLRQQLNVPEERMIFYGRSLGGAVAARQSAEFTGAGLVLDSAFINGKEIASDLYPFIPGFLVSIRFPVDEDLQRSAVGKVMVMHAQNDRIISIRHGKELYRIADEDDSKSASFVELRGGHNSSFIESREIYAQRWAEFLSKIDNSD